MKQIIQSLPYPEYSTIERDALTNIPYGYIIYNTDNNILEMFDYSDAWITWLSGGSQIPLSNTVWVNLDLTENDTTNHIFKSWVDAKDWIIANTDYSESNLWQIMLPSGNVGDVTFIEGIRLGVTDGTVIERLGSNITFDGDSNTVLKAYLAGAIINNLDLGGNGKCCALYNCVVNNVIAATSTVIYLANDCQFLAGDFENYIGNQTKCRYIPILGDIDNLSSNGRFNEFALVDGFALNLIDIKESFSIIYATSISGKLNIENCFCSDLSLSAEARITNSVMSNITGTGTANINIKNSNVGNVILEDTATLTHENSIIGTSTVATGATLTRISEPYDNTISGLNALNVQDAIDELTTLGGGLIPIKYDDLILAINHSELKPGSQYLIIDFQTVHHILDNSTSRTGDINIGELEPLIVKAVSVNELDKEAISTVYPKDIIYYNITSDIRDIAFYNDDESPVAKYKGQIYFRHDTIQNVSAWYDFRNVKFRRWLVRATAWVNGSSYTAKDVVEYNNILYKCKVTHSGVSTPPNNSTNWIKWLDKTVPWSWTSDKTQFNVGNITTNNLTMSNPADLFTFGDYYEHVKDISIGRNDLSLLIGTYGFATILNNIVFNTTDDITTCLSNTFSELCVNNTIGNSFYFNTIGDNFHHNTIGNSFQSNNIGNVFYFNTIGNDFGDNTTGNVFFSNTIGNNFNYNTIGDTFHSNTIGNGFNYNTIKSNIGDIDFTQATHVYGEYDCEIFKRLDGTVRLRYTDDTDTILTVAPDV